MALNDLTGQKFGRLTVLKLHEINIRHEAMWLCQCECGKTKIVRSNSLTSGLIVSCGCYHKEMLKMRLTTHGQSHTRLFNIWQNVKRRCYNPNYKYYSYYGGRGITMIEEWKNDFGVFQKWATENGYKNNLTLDRIDSDGNYEPSNCRWATRQTQQNNLRSNHRYTINGEEKTLMEWCKIYGVPHERTRNRVVNRGWDILDALTIPPFQRRK